ncbi:MAG: DUF3168 domain-containing protein [Phyllobacterium sp.]
MSNANLELQKAFFAAFRADAPLVSMLGGEKFYDHVPPAAVFPYITFGRTMVYDWSTDSDRGCEHLSTIHVWSRAGGKSQALSIMGEVERVIQDAVLTLDGHRLVNIRLEYTEALNDDDRDGYHGLLRYRSVTEPA